MIDHQLIIATWLLVAATFLSGVAIVIATFRSPIIAISMQNKLQRQEERKNIFKTLMLTRAQKVVSQEHADAFNKICFEFEDKKYINVKRSWERLNVHLNKFPGKDVNGNIAFYDNKIWGDKRLSLLSDLLTIMGTSLDYDISLVDIENKCYATDALSNKPIEEQMLRQQLINATALSALKVNMEILSQSPVSSPTAKKDYYDI